MDSKEFYTAESNLADTLVLDISADSPTARETLKRTTKSVQELIESRYGTFIPEQKLEANHDLPDRTMTTDPKTMEKFGKAWDNVNPRDSKNPLAIHTKNGELLVLNSPMVSWNALTDEEQDQYIQKYGSKKEAITQATGAFYLHGLVHEIIHAYQDGDTPNQFREIGAYYYESILIEELGDGDYLDKKELLSIRREVDKIVRKYGDNFHRVQFGLKVDPVLKQKIINEYKNSIELMFFLLDNY